MVRECGIQFINIDEKVLTVIRFTDEDFEKVENLDQQDLVVSLISFTNNMVRINLADCLNV